MSAVPARLLSAATALFAARGYEGTSVRAICSAAQTNLNAVTYHFGGKQALYAAVIQGVGERRLASAHRILAHPAATPAELETRLVLFAEETLASWLEEPGVLKILMAELQQGFRNCGEEALAPLAEHSAVVNAFLTAAQGDGLLRGSVDVDIVVGSLLERLNGQVLYAGVVQSQYGTSILDPDYRRHWVQQTIALLLHGAAER